MIGLYEVFIVRAVHHTRGRNERRTLAQTSHFLLDLTKLACMICMFFTDLIMAQLYIRNRTYQVAYFLQCMCASIAFL